MNEAKAVGAGFTLKPVPPPDPARFTRVTLTPKTKKLKAPRSVRVQVPAGRTVKKTFKVRAVKRKKGKVRLTAKLGSSTTRSTVTLTR